MAERWTEIKRVNDDIDANRRGKKRTQNEIELLQNQLNNYDKDYESLRLHKQFLGKEIYGNPTIRRELVERGLKSGNFRVREVAQQLREVDKNIKWDQDVQEELINICLYIDIGVTKISNWNIKKILYEIGKFGYEEIQNIEGK